MKKNRIVVLLLIFMLGICTLFSCKEKGTGSIVAKIETQTETLVAIRVEEVDSDGVSLLTVMESLNNFTFEMQNGMLTSINGRTNGISSYWMLYTSDKELANTEWGTVEYNGESLGSAIVGAESLTVLKGEVYVWYYQQF